MKSKTLSLLPAQRQFISSTAAHPAIVGGLGSGKSAAATLRLILRMLARPGINTLMAMPTYDLLRLRAMPGAEDDLSRLGLAYRVNKSEYSITINGYGTIYFRSYDRPERMVAFEVAHTVLDELDTLPQDKAAIVWRKASERTRQDCGGTNTIANVTTPDQGVNGFTYQKWGKNLQPGYELIHAATTDNFFLPPGYVEQIRANYDPILADAYLRGQFVSFNQDKVYHLFSRQKHHTDRTIKTGEHLHVGVDFNIGGCAAVVFVLDGKGAIAVDEFVSHDTRDMSHKLFSRYQNKHKITIYPDASGKAQRTNASQSDIQILEAAGYLVDAPNGNPAIRDRVNAVNGLLAHSQLLVNCDMCPELATAMERQGYTKEGDPEKWDQHPAMDDWVDAAGYMIHRRFGLERNVFVTGFR
jgi:PBSX family phage terminase large subunit